MKPYQDLTYGGRLSRMRQLARLALQEYGLQDAPFKLVVWAGNTLFRVYGPVSPFTPVNDNLFEPGQYLLRVHEPGYQEPEAIDLELTWLAAMRREADLPVPEPIATRDGQWVAAINAPDDSGFGYWVFDLAVALDACRDDPAYPRYRDALLNGYAEFRALSEQQAAQIELFLAGLQVYWNLWATGGTHLYPDLLPEYRERIARTADFVVRYARQKGCPL